MRFVMFILLIPFYPEAAYAYVDPGFITALYQLAYVLIFGVLATFILNPWRSLKTWFLSVFSKSNAKDPVSLKRSIRIEKGKDSRHSDGGSQP
jgi:hypothetical protein